MQQSRPKSVVKELALVGKKHVALLHGGMSAEREVSLSSGKGVGESLVGIGYQVTSIDVGEDIGAVLLSLQPQVVFNCLHGTYGEDGCIPGLMNIMKIPYTHSGLQASAMALDKNVSKMIMTYHKIPTAPSVLVSKCEVLPNMDPIPRPYVIKPLSQGSSIGVELVFPTDTNFSLHNYEFNYGDPVLIEKYIKGREFNIAVLNGKALGILEIKVLNGKRFYDYESKYTNGFTQHIIPPILPIEISKKILELSEKVYAVFNCRGLARVECILGDDNNEIYVLEINTHPGMTPLSICPEIALFSGITFNQLVEKMLVSAKCDP